MGEALINGANSKFGSFSERNKQGAMTAGEKATYVKNYGLINHAMLLWQDVTKTERLLRYYSTRVEHKKHQLQGLQKLSKSDNSVSLPNIHQKPPSQRSGGSGKGSSKKDFAETAPAQEVPPEPVPAS